MPTMGLVVCYDHDQRRFLIVNEKLGGAWYADKPQSGPSELGLNFFAFVPNFAADKTVFAGLNEGGLYSYTAVIYDLFSTPTNKPPQANAGPNQTVPINVPVTLNGGGSTDPDSNYPLNYQWEIVSSPNWPASPFPPLENPTSATPTFTPTAYGDYVVKLVVTDNAGAISLPAYVTISTVRSDPVADAGPDQVFTVLNNTITLDGTKSYDYDDDLTSYDWTIINQPQGSTVTLSGANTANPTFAPDIYGDYILQLVVRDSTGGASQPDTVTVSCNNVPPIAKIGIAIPIPGIPGQSVFVSGQNSSDPNEDKITYRWSFSSIPEGSQVTFADPGAMETHFIPDKAGTYVVNLVVNDGFLNSDPALATLIIISVETGVTPIIRDLQNTILGMAPGFFRNDNTNLRDALYNKLNAVINCLEANNINGALAQLQQDFLGKVDGNANSWVLPSQEQLEFYQEVLHLIAILESAS
jgi:hypothetical protein